MIPPMGDSASRADAQLLTVACVRWGDKFARQLSVPHRFVCVTAEPVESVECRAPAWDFPGWWQKVGLFEGGFFDGPTVYCDLDTVLVGSVDWVCGYLDSDLAAIENWGSRKHEGPLYEDEVSSAFMVWRGCGGPADAIFEKFTPAEIDRLTPHGDQAWITEVMRGKVDLIPQERICSYKRHCLGRQAPPQAASVIAFHGRPMPHEVSDPWVLEHWSC
jgi:hypothetical protein